MRDLLATHRPEKLIFAYIGDLATVKVLLEKANQHLR